MILTSTHYTGPTNSGKTYHALEALKNSNSGVYCAPLRLLALEVYEKLNETLPAHLVTGDDRREEEQEAHHVACTMEMADLDTVRDVAVLDEIQMIGDPQRGWAWTRALLGIPAYDVHLCGSDAAVPIVTRLCEATGDHLEVKRYQRLVPLEVEKTSLKGDLADVQSGDCVVAFSRKELYKLKKEIERHTAKKCAIIYGSLPPDVRATQAKRFNNGEYEVLVASDAIGMGLNLHIRRVIFSAMEKYNGVEVIPFN